MSFQRTIERLIPDPPVRRYLALFSIAFAVSLPAGLYAPQAVLGELGKAFDEMTAPLHDMTGGTFFLLVLLNNVFASLLMLLSGLLAGIIPALSVPGNGFLMGLIYRHLAAESGRGNALLELLPQALFEVPALLVLASYGFWLGMAAIRRFRGREERPLAEFLNRAVERYFSLVFPLLIAAAAAETVLTLRRG
jgi:stage II sporulation protein M